MSYKKSKKSEVIEDENYSLKKLQELKKHVRNWQQYWKRNNTRYTEVTNLVCNSWITPSDKAVLNIQKKPVIEANVTDAMVSRLRGEWAKNEPSVQVSATEDAKVNPIIPRIVEDNLRHIVYEANRESCEYDVMSDLLYGGFSGLRYWTEYAHPLATHQVIKVGRVLDPTTVGYDILAHKKTKSDGRFCFEYFPQSKDEFKQENPDTDVSQVSFTRTQGDFNWSYNNGDEDIVVICLFYEKKRIPVTIVNVVDNGIMTQKEYDDFVDEWSNEHRFEAVPAIIGKPRKTFIEKICRFKFIENKILEYVETDYPSLPIKFVDGNSRDIIDYDNSRYQMTRPYIYNAIGPQRFKNYALQCATNEFENLIQSKHWIAEESLPTDEGFLDNIINPQQASTYVWRSRNKDHPEMENPPPMPIQRAPIPTEIFQGIQMADQMIQAALGDFQNEINRSAGNDASGKAIIASASLNNAAAEPYLVGYMQAWGDVLNDVAKLLPKYMVGPRTLKLLLKNGIHKDQKINQEGGIDLSYSDNDLQVKVEPGVNFQIQKNIALQQIINLMQVSPEFQAMMMEMGPGVLLDNMEFRGVDQIKEMVGEWMKRKQAMKKEAMENSPEAQAMAIEKQKLMLEAQKMQLDKQIADMNASIKVAQMSADNRKQDVETFKIMTQAKMDEANNMAKIAESDAKTEREHIKQAMDLVDMSHRHNKEAMELEHNIKIDHHDASHKDKTLESKEKIDKMGRPVLNRKNKND